MISKRTHVTAVLSSRTLFVLSLLLIFGGSQSACARDYFGLVDTKGKVVLPCEYAAIRVVTPADPKKYVVKPFPKNNNDSTELFVVDNSGKILHESAPPEEPYKPLPPPGYLPLDEYETVNTSSPNGSMLGIKNKKTGAMAIPFQSSDQQLAFPLGDGMFAQMEFVEDKVRTKLIKEGGEFVAYAPDGFKIPMFRQFTSGFVLAENSATGKVGFLDKEGKLLGNKVYANAEPFSEGFAAVVYLEKDIEYSGMINPSGEFAYGPFKNVIVEAFYDGLARTFRRTAAADPEKILYGLINRDFKTVLEPDYPLIRIGGRNILARTPRSQGFKWNLFDISGNLVFHFPNDVTLIDEYAGDDNSFVVAVDKMPLDKLPFFGTSDHAKYGFVDKKGAFFIEPKYDSASPFRDGVAVVSISQKTPSGQIESVSGLIDKNGNYVIKPCYSQLIHYRPLLVAMEKRGPSFDSYRWKNPDQPFNNRSNQWNVFLASYEIIGMNRNQVFELLGDPDEVPRPDRGSRSMTGQLDETALKVARENALRLPVVTYNICGGICGYSSTMVQFEFLNDKVVGWRTGNSSEKPGPWIKGSKIKPSP